MVQEDFEKFLAETLPEMGYVWRRFSRKNVRRKLRQRMDSLRIQEFTRYRELLLKSPEEQAVFQSLLRVTITRFFRNADVWEQLGRILVREGEVLDSGTVLSSWSAGCAGGEEPYSLAMLLEELSRKDELLLPWTILGTDSDEASLKRADRLIYKRGSIREVPPELLERWFDVVDDRWLLNPEITEKAAIRSHNTLEGPPPGDFHLALVRNSVFTYNTPDVRNRFTRMLRENLSSPGLLVIGRKESLPEDSGFEQVGRCIYKKTENRDQRTEVRDT